MVPLGPDNGQIPKHNTLPGGEGPIADVKFTFRSPDDHTRAHNDPQRPDAPAGLHAAAHHGYSSWCGIEGMKQPSSVLVAAHPDTLELLDMLRLPEPASSRHILTMLEGRIAIYIGMSAAPIPRTA